MRESVGETGTFQYILIFTLLFSAFLALAIVYNKVFKLKNESLFIIEKYEGVNDESLSLVNNYLKNNGYSTKHKCPKKGTRRYGQEKEDEDEDEDQYMEIYGVNDLDSGGYEKAEENKKYYYCLANRTINSINGDKIYYRITLFYNFNLPFLGDFLTFEINGETKAINYYKEDQRLKD